jgi:DmsE family decaheme c-type cytochrome
MRLFCRLLGLTSLALVLGLAASLAAATEGAATAADSPCAQCHDDVAAAFALTAHGLPQRAGATCVACHGDGERHMDEGDPALIRKPLGRDGQGTCLTCHAPVLSQAVAVTAAHSHAGVFCDACHVVHPGAGAPPVHLLREQPLALCTSCHPSQEAAFRRPFGHDLRDSGVTCVSCHDPHGGRGARSLVLDRSGEGPCVTCHAEKRGPFVFPHVGSTAGSCLSCHQPHGSSNPMALTRAKVAQLCLECHSPTTGGTLGSQPPSFHDLLSPRYAQCTVCHVAIHGSNSSPSLLR